ncbi:MAG: DUF2147 domain-containing protein [Sphingomicrobium sp.]
MDRFLIIAAGFACASAPAFAAVPIEGNWTNPARNVTVRIAPCGGESLCGRVTSASAKARNDAARGGTPDLIGAELMSGLEQNGPASWHGQVLVADVGQRADAQFRLIDRSHLDVRGCALGGLICKSQTWTRVTGTVRRRVRSR